MALDTAERRGLSLAPANTRPVAVAGWAGILGPVLFSVVFLAQDAVRPGGYDPVTEPVSALAAGPTWWLHQLNFVAFGVLTLVFAVGLHVGVRRTRLGWLGPALLFVSGIGLLLGAAFPLAEDASGATYDPGGHFVAGMLFFPTSAVALVALSHRLRSDPRWRSLATYTLAAGAVALAGGVTMVAFVVPDEAPLHAWAGLAQRVLILAVLFPCRVALGARLLREGSTSEQPPHSSI
ncbi:MAG TPA: DUF998 domain-containing protein [Micromonosporaceae bacterium]|jgi:hypothetical membrane protein